LLTNYHTHTSRCRHATGTDREYVEHAIQGGLKVFGFSDHAPCIFDGDYYSTYRMYPEQTGEYVESIRTLGEEYKSRITLLAGYEIEYYPNLLSRTLRFLSDFGCDYLLQGQHFIGDEEKYSGATDSPQLFDRYVKQTIEGMETGLFVYLCHPDLCQCRTDMKLTEKGFGMICEAALRLNVPLEMNMYGLSDHRHYPSELFFRIAAEVGNTIVPAFDAHTPQRLSNPQEIIDAEAFARRCGFSYTELSVEQVLAKKHLIK